MPGRIRPVKLGVNPLRSKAFNRQCNLNVFTPNLTSQMPLTGNVISMDLHPIRPVKLGVNPLRL